MAEILWAGWINGISLSPDVLHPVFLTRTFPPGMDLFVTVSISSFSIGFHPTRGLGVVGSAVRRWEVFNPDGSVQHVDPGPDRADLNSVFIRNCASVSVELAVRHANAWAQVSIWRI